MSYDRNEGTRKSGYEVRVDILTLAAKLVEMEYNAEVADWEATARTNGTPPNERPIIPCVDDVVDAAKVLYAFVNAKGN